MNLKSLTTSFIVTLLSVEPALPSLPGSSGKEKNALVSLSSQALIQPGRWVRRPLEKTSVLFHNTRSPRRASRGVFAGGVERALRWLDWELQDVVISVFPVGALPEGVWPAWDGKLRFRWPSRRVPHFFLAQSASESSGGGVHDEDGSGFHSPYADTGLSVRVKVSHINHSLRHRLRERLEAARRRGRFGVLSTAMEMPLRAPNVEFQRQGPGGGGQGVFMEEQPWAISEEGVAASVCSPLFKADVDKNFGSLEAFMQAFGAQKLMDIELPIGRGSIPLEVLYLEQDGVPVFLLYDASGHFFHTLYGQPNPDSIGAYIEAILLPMAAIEIPRQLGIQYEASHFNDWQTAFGPSILREAYRNAGWALDSTGARPDHSQFGVSRRVSRVDAF